MTSKKYKMLTIATTEDELLGIGGENAEGFYASMKYFQSQKNENNIAFVKAFKEMWGEDSVIGDVTQAAYLGPWIWKAAVEKAGSFDIDKIHALNYRMPLKVMCVFTKLISTYTVKLKSARC
jgi:urea transport system substrate-binding protein